MSFRARLTLAVALAVAVAVAATSAITYVLVRNELRGQVDDALRERVSSVRLRVVTDPVTGEPQLDLPPDRFGGAAGITQLVTADGDAIRSRDATVELPVSERARQTAAGDRSTVLRRRARRRHASPRLHAPRRQPWARAPDRAAARGGRRGARPDQSAPVPDRRRRDRDRGRAGSHRREGRARTGPAADQDGRGGVGDTRPLPPDRRVRQRRALAPRGDVQHDARRARGLGAGAAAARLRRVARAADAADEPAHEHRGARARRGACRPATASSCCATSPSS